MTVSDTTAEARPQALRRLGRVGVYAGRAALAIVVVVVGLWAAGGLRALLGPRDTAARDTAGPEPVASEASDSAAWLAALDAPGGGWTLAGLPLLLSVRRLPRAEAEAHLEDLPPTTAVAGNAGEVMALARAVGGTRRSRGGYGLYSFGLGEARAVLFTEGAGTEEVPVLARAVCGLGASGCLIEATPVASAAATAEGTAELLPLPDGGRRLATRRGAGGILVAEVAVVAQKTTDLRSFWQAAGCQPEDAIRGGRPQSVACRWRGREVVAWLWPGAGREAETTLVLQIALTAGGER